MCPGVVTIGPVEMRDRVELPPQRAGDDAVEAAAGAKMFTQPKRLLAAEIRQSVVALFAAGAGIDLAVADGRRTLPRMWR